MLALIKWEYLAHRLPALERLDYAFVGPEWGDEERKGGKIPSCPECEDIGIGRSISYREFNGATKILSSLRGFISQTS